MNAGTPELDLDLYSDAAAMRDRLQRLLPGFADGALRIEALQVRQARRNTSRRRNPSPLTLCYELHVIDTVHGRSGTQLLCAQVFRAGADDAAYRFHAGARLVAPAFGAPLAHLPQLGMVAWSLPNDPALPQLVALLDPAALADALPWEALGAPREDFGAIEVELLRYDPQRRATLRCTLAGRAGGAPRVVYAKTFADGQASAIQRRFEHFWQLDAADAPRVARPLGACARMRTFWQDEARGVPLLQALADAGDAGAAALMRGVARALAHVHAAPPALACDAEPRTVDHWVAEAHRRQVKLARADAALAGRAARLADAIEAGAARQRTRAQTLIHGDFHPHQMWVDGARIVLFDFDEFTLGDPMEDLAGCVLKLQRDGVDAALVSTLLQAYAAAAPHRFDRPGLHWHLALQGLVQACRAFVFQRPGWEHELERRLAASEALAASLNLETVQ